MRSFCFVALGVGITVEADRPGPVDWIRSRIDSLLAGHAEEVEGRRIAHRFSVLSGEGGSVSLFHDGEEIGSSASEALALKYLAERIKLAVAASTRTHVVVHAGVVGVGERVVVLPGHSFGGKTTLVRELMSRGAAYFSDDFAVVDRQGLVQPFPKTLSLRGISGEYAQVEHTAESLGGVVGKTPLPVGLVLFTAYAPHAVWRPQEVSQGLAVLKLAEHTVNLRAMPHESLAVLGRMVSDGSALWASPRSEAAEVADQILEHMRHC